METGGGVTSVVEMVAGMTGQKGDARVLVIKEERETLICVGRKERRKIRFQSLTLIPCECDSRL